METETHSHPSKKKVINRFSRIIGHMEAIKRMIDEDRDCSEVLIQIAAVKSALNNAGKVILKEHMNHCVVDAVKNNDMDKLIELEGAIDKFIK